MGTGQMCDSELKKWCALTSMLPYTNPMAGDAWGKPTSKECGTSPQGHKVAMGKGALYPREGQGVPKGEGATRAKIVIACRPEGQPPCRARATARWHSLGYNGRAATGSTGMATIKCHLGSTLPSPDHRCATLGCPSMHSEGYLGQPPDMVRNNLISDQNK